MPAQSFARASLLLLHRKSGRDIPIKGAFGRFTVLAEARTADVNRASGLFPSRDFPEGRAGQSKEMLPLDR